MSKLEESCGWFFEEWFDASRWAAVEIVGVTDLSKLSKEQALKCMALADDNFKLVKL